MVLSLEELGRFGQEDLRQIRSMEQEIDKVICDNKVDRSGYFVLDVPPLSKSIIDNLVRKYTMAGWEIKYTAYNIGYGPDIARFSLCPKL